MSLGTETLPDAQAAYDRRMARWRTIVDWAKTRPWVIKAIGPLSRGTGQLRFVDRLTDRAIAAPARPDFERLLASKLGVCWLGHATMLIRVGGVTILTDPVFSSRVGLGWGLGTLGPARFVKPACAIGELPPIDLILLSHAHFDHLDRPTLARLPKTSTVVCARGTRDLVDDLGFARVVELDLHESSGTGIPACVRPQAEVGSDASTRPTQTGMTLPLEQIKVTAMPVRHWGARTILDAGRGYCAYLVETPDGTRVLYGGDSAAHEHWQPIGAGGGVDLAIVGIGAYDPWIGGHANPEQAWQMATRDAGARKVAAMHHLTFKLSNEPMADPMRRLLLAAGDRAADVVCRSIGDVWGDP